MRDIGVDRPGKMPGHHYKCYVALDDRAFENWKTFARQFMTHVNPYTGRRNADEPGMPFVSLVNENTFWVGWSGKRNDPVVRKAYAEWLAERRAADPAFCPEAPKDSSGLFFHEGENSVLAMFLADVERRSVTRQKEFLRSLGCKAMFTSMNCGPDFAPMQEVRSECFDYVDTHFYADHPRFPVVSWKLPSTCPNENPFRGGWRELAETAFLRLADKPLAVSEWNFSGPGRYRGVGGIATGALAALQDWDALWRFAYSHSCGNWPTGKGRLGYFDVATDPLMRFSDIAVVFLFLRGDMPSLKSGFSLDVTPTAVAGKGGGAFGVMPEWADSAVWKARVATSVAGRSPDGMKRLALDRHFGLDRNPVSAAETCSAVTVDRKSGSFAIVSKRTCGGFREAGRLVAGPLTAEIQDAPATLWVSSLDGQPIGKSQRMLLLHLTDVQNEGAVYGEEKRTTLLNWGEGRPLVCNGCAHVSIAVDAPARYAVWELATDGSRVCKLKSSEIGGRLVFDVSVFGLKGARVAYEIAR